MTDKWQCSKCKETSVVEIIKIEGKIIPEDKEKIKCCCRRKRNLTEAQYTNESSINDSGARG